MSLIVIAVCASVAASLGYLAARKRDRPAAPEEENARPPVKPWVKGKPKVAGTAHEPVKPGKKAKGAPPDANTMSPFDGLPLSLGDVVSVEREERWLAGALVATEGGRVHSVLFLAPEGAEVCGVAVFAPPRRDLFWLTPVGIEAPEEPPTTLAIGGVTLTRRARIPVSLQRLGQGAPQVGESGLWAVYEGTGRNVALLVSTTGRVHAWSGVRFEEGEYDRMGGGGD